MVAIVLIWNFILMLLGLDLVLYILGYLYILYVTLFRLIALYSRCRVNRDTNMFVVYALCNFCYCFHCVFGLPVWRSQIVGRIPTELWSAPYHLAFPILGIWGLGTPLVGTRRSDYAEQQLPF